MIELAVVVLACLGTVVTGIGTAWLWVEHIRLERRIAKLELRASEMQLDATMRELRGLKRIPPDAVQREWA
jgi:hypothetical protein